MSDYQLLVGDCIESMREIPDQSVHCCVTSPPYFGLRDYGHDGQIGLEATPDAYVAKLVDVFREARRVLRDDGTLFLNLGDSYHSSGPRQTGRNDANRETPGGRGGSFRGGVRRAISYGISGTALEGSQECGCLCGSLCDVCRRAYLIGKSHSDAPRVPMPDASMLLSSRAHTGSESDRLPTSDLPGQADHSAAANPDLGQTAGRAVAPLPDAPASMPRESSRQHPEDFHLSGQPLECRLCGCSLQGSALASAHTVACNCDTAQHGSVSGNSGTGVVSSAYPHLTTESLKPKDLIGIPWRVAFALQADGWYLRQDIIWSKPNPMPESVTDRCTKAHEYVFMLSKSARYFYDADAIKEPVTRGYAGSSFTVGKTADHQLGRSQEGDRVEDERRNRRSVWTVSTKPYAGAHFATFPPDLIEPCILAGCPRGGTVLDPFCGSGTTAGVAMRNGRSAILCELNPEYAALVPDRVAALGGNQMGLAI